MAYPLRQDSLPAGAQNAAFEKITAPFDSIKTEADVFDAGRNGLDVLLDAATPKSAGTRQERLLTLMVGKLHDAPLSTRRLFRPHL